MRNLAGQLDHGSLECADESEREGTGRPFAPPLAQPISQAPTRQASTTPATAAGIAKSSEPRRRRRPRRPRRLQPPARGDWLGATKGSFYWHFRNREQLISEALKSWEGDGTDDMITELAGVSDPVERLRQLLAIAIGYEDDDAAAKRTSA